MPTTSNFGWTTPADTDLVKDGAAAIRTLGNGIDTSLVDLKGGTTGQVLSKTSNTDLDFTWINNDQGDITEVTAGTGITGGGTTGAVTITNDMATTITAAGDIVVGTGNATYDNLPIGSTGQVLTADTTVSPYKVKWATASATPGSAQSFVTTKQTTTSSSYTGLTTAQAVTLTTGTKVMVCLTCKLEPNSTNYLYMSYAISGATTVSASDSRSIAFGPYASVTSAPELTYSAVYFHTVTAGSNTFTAQFRTTGGTAYFLDRQILVVDLGS